MSPPRIAILVRRFWPLADCAARAAGLLVDGLVERGCRVTVLTARPAARGPIQIDCGGAGVVRLAAPPTGMWDRRRYVRAIGRWLAQHRGDCDLVYVFGLKQEAYAALRAVGGELPVVLRPERSGPAGDCFWQLEAPDGRRIKRECLRAAANVAATPLLEAELKAAGYPRPRIHYLPVGVPIPPARSAGTKIEARRVLARAHKLLQLPRLAPLLVYAGPLKPDCGLETLLAAWRRLLARWPNARLWLTGTGPLRDELLERIESMGLAGRVLLPGAFDDLGLLLAATDALVLPGTEDGTPLAMFEAMAAGLPVVAADTPGHRVLAAHEETALLVPADDASAWLAALTKLLGRSGLAQQLGAAGRRRIAREFTLASSVQQHLTLFEQLIRRTDDESTP